jgi:hypothetical protein
MTERRAAGLRLPDPPQQWDATWMSRVLREIERGFEDAVKYNEPTNVQSVTLAAGDNDNYEAGQFTRTLRVTPDGGGSAIAGLAEGRPGRQLRIIALGDDLTIKHEDTGSSAVNRIRVPSGEDIVLTTDDLVDLEYDPITARWRVLFSTGVISSEVGATPSISYVAMDTPVDDSLDIDYSVYWGVSNAPYPAYSITLDFYLDGSSTSSHTVTGVDTAASQPYATTAGGDGGLATGTHTARVRAQLIRASDSAVVGTVSSSAVNFEGNP